MNFLRRVSITSESNAKALKQEDIVPDPATTDIAKTDPVPAVDTAAIAVKDPDNSSFASDTTPSASARADNVVVSMPSGVRQSRRLSLRQLNVPDDNLRMDAEFEAICRNTVAAQRGAYLYHHVNSNNKLGNAAHIGGEAFITNSASRMLNFYSGDGAAYSQYDFGRQEFSGGPLPKPWKAVRSRTTGQVYYANTQTGATQWDPPLYPLSREWRMAESPQSGAVFYVHKETGRWQWERPVDNLFLDLQSAGNSDKDALVAWKQRHGADCCFAGLENLRSAQPTLLALPGTQACLALADAESSGLSSSQSVSEDEVTAICDAVDAIPACMTDAESAPQLQFDNENNEDDQLHQVRENDEDHGVLHSQPDDEDHGNELDLDTESALAAQYNVVRSVSPTDDGAA